MRWEVYVASMLGISIMLYLMGYQPIISQFESKGVLEPAIGTASLDSSGNPVSSSNTGYLTGLIIAGCIGLSWLIVALLGYSAFFIIPIIILTVFLDFFIFPTGFLTSLPGQWPFIGVIFFNAMKILAVMNFVRGSV
jgi:hypothetical protein